MVMSAHNAWMNSASSQEANDAWEKNLNVYTQDKSNDHHHRREGKLSQSEIDRMVEEAENYRDEDEPRAQQVEHRDQAHETVKTCAKCWRRSRMTRLPKVVWRTG